MANFPSASGSAWDAWGYPMAERFASRPAIRWRSWNRTRAKARTALAKKGRAGSSNKNRMRLSGEDIVFNDWCRRARISSKVYFRRERPLVASRPPPIPGPKSWSIAPRSGIEQSEGDPRAGLKAIGPANSSASPVSGQRPKTVKGRQVVHGRVGPERPAFDQGCSLISRPIAPLRRSPMSAMANLAGAICKNRAQRLFSASVIQNPRRDHDPRAKKGRRAAPRVFPQFHERQRARLGRLRNTKSNALVNLDWTTTFHADAAAAREPRSRPAGRPTILDVAMPVDGRQTRGRRCRVTFWRGRRSRTIRPAYLEKGFRRRLLETVALCPRA